MALDKKTDGGKAPAKVETIHLRVFIHCEGCKKKVRKTLNGIEGVHVVEVDGNLGKVTVTGTVDSKVLIKKLEKAGKVAELIPNGGGKGKDQQKGANKEKAGANEKDEGSNESGNGNEKANKGNNSDGEGDKDNNENVNNSNTNQGNGHGGKKKKGGGGGGGGGANGTDESGGNKNMSANKSVAPVMVETAYSSTMESVEYATHMFSDENANNCIIM